MDSSAFLVHELRPASTLPGRSSHRVPSEFAFLRLIAGLRALLAVLAGIVLLVDANSHLGLEGVVILPYLVWAAVLLWKTLDGWPRAASKTWLWLRRWRVAGHEPNAGKHPAAAGHLHRAPGDRPRGPCRSRSGGGIGHRLRSRMLVLTGSLRSFGSLPPLPVSVPIIVLALGPAAALLARPSRDLRQHQKLVGILNERSDPRQGLRHEASMLLEQLASHFELRVATISLQGPEPRVFQWRADTQRRELAKAEATRWREQLAALPRDLGCICSGDGTLPPVVVALNPSSGVRSKSVSDDALRELQRMGAQTLTLPLMNYGQPLGTLCLRRAEVAFTAADLRFVNDLMHETMPLLERSDLLEQLQRESAARERERIGRDLHDSAVQPYLGLKYGLEALARQAGSRDPLSHHIQQLVQMTNEELQTLRDVISGLRRGNDTGQPDGAPLAALQRQAERFHSLYGLKVHVSAPHAPHLRGAAAKAVLHMVNEALTNARRHTTATAVTVLLDVNGTDVVLRVRNDHEHSHKLPADFVPRSLTERAAEFGGGIAVHHEPNLTEIVITLPLLGVVG